MDIVCDANIHAWHPNFKLEDVPQINEADFPQPPSTGIVDMFCCLCWLHVIESTTAKQVLEVY